MSRANSQLLRHLINNPDEDDDAKEQPDYMNTRFLIISIFLTIAIFGGNVFTQEEANKSHNKAKQEQTIGKGSSLAVHNKFGAVIVTGWNSNILQASAMNVNTLQPIPVKIIQDSSNDKKFSIAPVPENKRLRSGDIALEVKVPRDVKLEPIRSDGSEVQIKNIDGLVAVTTDSGDVHIRSVGSLDIHTESGTVTVEDVTGSSIVQSSNGDISAKNIKDDFTAKTENGNLRVENVGKILQVITVNGNVTAQNIQGNLGLVAVNGKINIRCVKGRVEINDASSQIQLAGIEGDVEVTTSNGKANFIGEIRVGKRYRLKTLSGAVSMLISDSLGFTATLSSYSGQVDSDFALGGKDPLSSNKKNRRLTGTIGDGQTQIEMDSFDGRVRLGKISSEAIQKCSEVKTND